MALESLDNVRDTLDLQELKQRSPNLHSVLKELQGLKFSVATGAAAATNIAITGITTSDTLVSVLQFVGAGTDITDVADRTSEASITSDGNIQLSSTDTTGGKLLVVWYDKE